MPIDYKNVRREYLQKELLEENMHENPIEQFAEWFQAAVSVHLDLPNAMTLATASKEGVPSARYVLMKAYSDKGFVFYTNSLSAKGEQMRDNPVAALVFYWAPLDRQIRIEGNVEILSDKDADDYFSSRPINAQISARASQQSREVTKEDLEQRVSELEQQYKDLEQVPRPEEWIGYRVVPSRIEFWQGREHRLHDRILYAKDNAQWKVSRLAP